MSYRSNRPNASRWTAHSRWLRSQVPAAVRSWLLYDGSLTGRLRATCRNGFNVRVLRESWQRPRPGEARVLKMRSGTLGWVREVQLLCDDKPLVFARTVVPVQTLSGARRRLVRLGTRPLGAYLFADPGTRRTAVELARIRDGEAMYAEATDGLQHRPAFIWGRRSVFQVDGKPLLVTEVFLPVIVPAS